MGEGWGRRGKRLPGAGVEGARVVGVGKLLLGCVCPGASVAHGFVVVLTCSTCLYVCIVCVCECVRVLCE
jgi:hypothetical protein